LIDGYLMIHSRHPSLHRANLVHTPLIFEWWPCHLWTGQLVRILARPGAGAGVSARPGALAQGPRSGVAATSREQVSESGPCHANSSRISTMSRRAARSGSGTDQSTNPGSSAADADMPGPFCPVITACLSCHGCRRASSALLLGAGVHHLLYRRFKTRQPLTYKLAGSRTSSD
jgi:hypothetical protein